MNYQEAFYTLKNDLQSLYDTQEAAAIAHEILYHITGQDKLQRLMQKDTLLTAAQATQFAHMQQELLTGKPMQYVLHAAWFMGRLFYVNEQVLIPRPETEELVQWIVDEAKADAPIELLDIGTGSGCIPVSLKLALPQAQVSSCDVSTAALAVAQRNAQQLLADINLLQVDFLSTARENLPSFDIIVSNPPYIPDTCRADMHTNVKDHEPALALFVPDDEPLLFYKAIAAFGHNHLKPGGAIYCELHADHAAFTKDMFAAAGYHTTILRHDMHGNPRMLKAMKA